eukprot:TRINITY_DN14508_c0_g1_i1.p2 TRINITY_DN14508_c0_g1~~TRINITY_DN14508_c0_g1_i1.p2  ORF type:complete len:269 (+),score=95.46 TRINITY_DN14508_c0_g1_i1:67-807(+)
MAQQASAEWLMHPEVHRKVTGGELVMLCQREKRRENAYVPLERNNAEMPETYITKCHPSRMQSPANHRPKEGDWSCRFCMRFNFWDHHQCAGCGRSKQLMEAGPGPLKDAVAGYYAQLQTIGLASADDVQQIRAVPALPLVPAEQRRQMEELTAPVDPFSMVAAPAALGGAPPAGAAQRYAGIGAQRQAPATPADPLEAFRAQKLQQTAAGLKEYKMHQAGAQVAAGACYKCGSTSHKVRDCRALM